MSIEFETSEEGNILISRFKGTLADHTLADYAYQLIHDGHLARHDRELVDGSLVTAVTLTPAGPQHLENVARNHPHLLLNYRLAMLGPSDLVFGMFRMWEMNIDDMAYQIKVFRQREEAMNWLLLGQESLKA